MFGEHAFRKHILGQGRRSVINASLWDVMSTGLSRNSGDMVEIHSDDLRAAFYRLIVDSEFVNAVTYGTNDVRRVRHRFEAARTMFQEVFNVHSA